MEVVSEWQNEKEERGRVEISNNIIIKKTFLSFSFDFYVPSKMREVCQLDEAKSLCDKLRKDRNFLCRFTFLFLPRQSARIHRGNTTLLLLMLLLLVELK